MSFKNGTVKQRVVLRVHPWYLKWIVLRYRFLSCLRALYLSGIYINVLFRISNGQHRMSSPPTSSSSSLSFRAGTVVWARLTTTWWPARIIDREALCHLDTARVWTSACRSKCIVNFFKHGSKMQLVNASLIREYTSNMALLNSAGRMRGAVFLACQDSNYWIRRHGNKHQKERVSDPLFLINSIQVRGNLAQVKKRNSRNLY